MVRELLAYIGG